MTLEIAPALHMWFVIVLAGAIMVSFAVERVSLELTALGLLASLLVFFTLFPLYGQDGDPLLGPDVLLAGFANPSLIAVLSLLIVGQAMVQTEALTPIINMFLRLARGSPGPGVAAALLGVLVVSAVMNNTPVVVMFIPILQILASKLGRSASSVMMPLSYAAILGGMTTLIGSSTNLLVSSALTELGLAPLGFFEFTVPGAIMAAAGAAYVVLVLPRILPDRASMTSQLFGGGKQFIAELDIGPDSPLVGRSPVAGHFPMLPDMTVRLVQRQGRNLLPPFENLVIEPGDVMIVAATRHALTEVLARNKGHLLGVEGDDNGRKTEPAVPASDRMLAEVMVAPAARMIDQSIEQIGFHRRFGCLVLGIQRRARMVQSRMGGIPLQAGDVLLILGRREDVEALGANRDLVLLAWSARELPRREKAPLAAAIFLATVGLAATGILPIAVAAVTGAILMVATDCLNIRQATRALDRRILLLVAATLALGKALEATGGAAYIAHGLVSAFMTPNPLVMLVVLFAIVALATNLLSNNACAILFTPIAVNLAEGLGIDTHIMAITVVLAANCSFATPIGYQTNLLVMGPGHYRFRDFLLGGLPLLVIMGLVYVLIAPWWFGL
ncbi:MAG TPA: SLC13 family permease [Arenibaculum sp.]|nr:SLC13 family permease [Arenibaculum sp.]